MTVTCAGVTDRQVKPLAGICNHGRTLMSFKASLSLAISREGLHRNTASLSCLVFPTALTSNSPKWLVSIRESQFERQCELCAIVVWL